LGSLVENLGDTMRQLTSNEIANISGGSVLGVICYGTIGFWVGGCFVWACSLLFQAPS
jgi:hypothetical protein